MNKKKDILDKIEKLSEVISTYFRTKNVEHVTIADRTLMAEVWNQLGFNKLQISCPSCVKYALEILHSYYEREAPKMPITIQPETPATTDEIEFVSRKVRNKK